MKASVVPFTIQVHANHLYRITEMTLLNQAKSRIQTSPCIKERVNLVLTSSKAMQCISDIRNGSVFGISSLVLKPHPSLFGANLISRRSKVSESKSCSSQTARRPVGPRHSLRGEHLTFFTTMECFVDGPKEILAQVPSPTNSLTTGRV